MVELWIDNSLSLCYGGFKSPSSMVSIVFSVDHVCKEELNLMLKVSGFHPFQRCVLCAKECKAGTSSIVMPMLI